MKIVNWVKNDRFFDVLRSTSARVLLWALGNIILFGGLIFCYNQERGLAIYATLVLLMVVAQKLSVRFVFDSDGKQIVDEYQRTRRDRSFSRAYRNVTVAFTSVIAVVIFYGYVIFFYDNGYFTLWPNAYLHWSLDTYHLLVVLIFLAGYFTLQPYFAWGFKGEPRRSKDEPTD